MRPGAFIHRRWNKLIFQHCDSDGERGTLIVTRKINHQSEWKSLIFIGTVCHWFALSVTVFLFVLNNKSFTGGCQKFTHHIFWSELSEQILYLHINKSAQVKSSRTVKIFLSKARHLRPRLVHGLFDSSYLTRWQSDRLCKKKTPECTLCVFHLSATCEPAYQYMRDRKSKRHMSRLD